MNRSSIFFSIILSFIISIILISISYILLSKESHKRHENFLMRKYFPIIKEIRKNDIDDDLIKNLNLLKFDIILDQEKIENIVNDKDVKNIFKKNEKLNEKNKIKNSPPMRAKKHIEAIFKNKNHVYVLFRKKGKRVLIYDKQQEDFSFSLAINLSFGVVFLVLIGSFIVTLKKLYPIKALQKKVKDFGDENFSSFDFKSDKSDEVSLLYNEFAKSALKLQNIKNARNIFIRNILHELKTPITKGRFLLELGGNKEKMQDIFKRLETLINEFALVESLASKSDTLKKDKIFLADIVENVQELLLLDDEDLECRFENVSLNVNFKYFCIAIKNLVDNAIKYSQNRKAIIKNDEENIIIINISSPLPLDIEAYKEPFGGIEEGGKKDSFGLGLYLVHNILKANNYKLQYVHKDGQNHLICKKM